MNAAETPRVVLVHGLWYRGVGMWPLGRRLERRGYRALRPSWKTAGGDFLDSADRLAHRVGGARAPVVHFVGHSLGGLLVLKMLERHGQRLPPGRVVLLGCPVHGSAAARRLADVPGLRRLLGGARSALTGGFAHAPVDRETGVIAGTSGVGAGRVLGGLAHPHDGTVAVSETELEGAADRLALPVTHTGLVLSGRVADAIDGFLREGRFSGVG